LTPLLARGLPRPIVERLVGTACADYGLGTGGVQLPTTPAASAAHDAGRYWRGPAWANINWLVVEGLRSHGFDRLADGLATQTVELVRSVGMREYFHAVDGRGLGAVDFGWTAAVTLDLVKQITID
jgi:glycogen debranching enzyme